MKIPLKHREVSSVVEGLPDPYTHFGEVKVFDYAHEDPLLGEISGHVFNRYLRFRKEESRFGTTYDFKFGGSNPHKAILATRHIVDKHDERQSEGRIKEVVYEKACEEMLYKAFEAVDAMHKLDNSFFDRIKYVFSPTNKQ